MSGPLDYAATHYPEMVDIPSVENPSMSEEDERMFEEASEALAQKAWKEFREKKRGQQGKRQEKQQEETCQ